MKKTAVSLFLASILFLSCATVESDDLKAGRNALIMLTVLQAKNAGRQQDTDTLFAKNARVWFETKEGEGAQLIPEDSGLWTDWDSFFNARKIDQNIKAYPDSVIVFESDQNDFCQLTERKPRLMAITYYFDKHGKISGKLVIGIKTIPDSSDRFDEATAWLRTEYPDEMKLLMPNGEIEPSLKNAKLWKQRLNEWRLTVGLDTLRFSLSNE